MRTYWRFLKIPNVKRLILSALPGRLAYGMVNLAIFFFVQEVSQSITLAGIATGTSTVTGSLSAGARGTVLDKFGQTKPLLLFIPAWVTCITVLSQQTSVHGIVASCFFLGMTSPPINLSTRPLWRDAVDSHDLRTAYAIDTTLLNFTGVVGPVIATTIAVHWSPRIALTITGLLMAIGGTLLLTMPLSRRWKPELKPHAVQSLLRNRKFQILAIEGAVFGLAWGILEISIPGIATLHGQRELAAPLMAALAGSSVIGGIIIGGRRSNVTPLQGFRRATALAAVATVPLIFTQPGISMGIALSVIGLVIGFAQVYHWEVLEAVRPKGSATSAQAWLWTVEGAMLAVGTAIGGFIVEHINPTTALVLVSCGLCVSSSFVWFYATNKLREADRLLSESQVAEAFADTQSSVE